MEISYSGPQLCLWVRMVVSGSHDLEEPSQVPMITGLVQHQKQETLFDALAGVATVLVKVLRPTPRIFWYLLNHQFFRQFYIHHFFFAWMLLYHYLWAILHH